MVEDFIRLAVDPVFPPPAGASVPATPRPTTAPPIHSVPVSPVLVPTGPGAAPQIPSSELFCKESDPRLAVAWLRCVV